MLLVKDFLQTERICVSEEQIYQGNIKSRFRNRSRNRIPNLELKPHPESECGILHQPTDRDQSTDIALNKKADRDSRVQTKQAVRSKGI